MTNVRTHSGAPNLVLLGPPGAGKGTQASRIADRWGLAHLSSGDLLREHRASQTPLGMEAQKYMETGGLVPDELVTAMVVERIKDTRAGLLLDGFPRSIAQAEVLAARLRARDRRLDAVLRLDLADDIVLRRLSGRRVCSAGHPYHVDFSPPTFDGRCDIDGRPLRQRDDDHPDTVLRRLDVYHSASEPLVGFYERLGLLRRVDAAADPEAVWEEIERAVTPLAS